jgi:hypothetical protein
MTVADRHVEHARVLVQIQGFAQLLADDLQRVVDDGIIRARPRRLLVRADGTPIRTWRVARKADIHECSPLPRLQT